MAVSFVNDYALTLETTTTNCSVALASINVNDLIFIQMGTGNSATDQVSSFTLSSGAATFTKLTGASKAYTGSGDTSYISTWMGVVTSSGTTPTLTCLKTATCQMAGVAALWTGLPGAAVSDVAKITETDNSTSCSSGSSGTLAQANEIAVGVASDNAGTGQTYGSIPGSWLNKLTNVNADISFCIVQQIVASTAALTFSATLGTSTDNTGTVCTFKIPSSLAGINSMPWETPATENNKNFSDFFSNYFPTANYFASTSLATMPWEAPLEKLEPPEFFFNYLPAATVVVINTFIAAMAWESPAGVARRAASEFQINKIPSALPVRGMPWEITPGVDRRQGVPDFQTDKFPSSIRFLPSMPWETILPKRKSAPEFQIDYKTTSPIVATLLLAMAWETPYSERNAKLIEYFNNFFPSPNIIPPSPPAWSPAYNPAPIGRQAPPVLQQFRKSQVLLGQTLTSQTPSLKQTRGTEAVVQQTRTTQPSLKQTRNKPPTLT